MKIAFYGATRQQSDVKKEKNFETKFAMTSCKHDEEIYLLRKTKERDGAIKNILHNNKNSISAMSGAKTS